MPTLWPFAPSENLVESQQWRTDVIRPYSTEQRIRLAEIPRTTFNFASALTYRQLERAKLIAESVAGGTYYLPVWYAAKRFTANSGVSSITVSTDYCGYSTSGYACLWQSDEACEVIAIASVASGSIGLEAATTRAYTDALIMPVVVAYCRDGFEAQRDANKITAVSAEWDVFEGSDIGGTTIYPTYRGYPAVTSVPTIGEGSVSETFGTKIDDADNGLAAPFYDSIQSQFSRSLSAAWMPDSLADLWFTRQFFHHIKGKQGAFWLPDWTRGLTLAANIAPSDTTITVQSVGLDVTGETGDLFIQDSSGTQTRLQYTAVNVSGANEVLTLTGAAGITLTTANATTVCRMRLCRLAQDRVEFSHLHLGSERMITKIQVLCDEVPLA